MQVFLSCISEIKASTCPQAPPPPHIIYVVRYSWRLKWLFRIAKIFLVLQRQWHQELQPVAKMLRHLTRKTLFLPKHRIKSHISKIKQLPSPSPIFNVVLRKFQHDLLLWPTLRRERGGSKTRGPYRYPWRPNLVQCLKSYCKWLSKCRGKLLFDFAVVLEEREICTGYSLKRTSA